MATPTTILARLVCWTTSSETVDPMHAVVELTDKNVKELIGLRDVFRDVFRKVAIKYHRDLYCIELFFDTTCRFGSLHEPELVDEAFGDADPAWHDVPYNGEPVDLLTEERVDAATLKVTDSGVLWSASPHHGEGYFETPELSWGQLAELLEKVPARKPRRKPRRKA